MDSIEAIRVLRKYFPTARIRLEAAVIDEPQRVQRLAWTILVTLPIREGDLLPVVHVACDRPDIGAAVAGIAEKAGIDLAAVV